MLDASTVPMEAYERLLAEYRALVEHGQYLMVLGAPLAQRVRVFRDCSDGR